MKRKLMNEKGFTLVELIVVIAIMVTLVALLLPKAIGYITRAREAKIQGNCAEIYNAACVYVSDRLSKGDEFEPDSDLDETLLWSGDTHLVDEPDDYTDIEIKINESGNAVKYVYYTADNITACVPENARTAATPG